MNWRAIAIGAAVGVGIGIVALTFSMTTNLYANPDFGPWLAWLMRVVGFLADVATGAVAGYLAARQGALHGMLAGLLGTVVGHVVGTVATIVKYGQNVYADMPAVVWIQMLAWALVGVGIAAVAGLLAAPLGARSQAQGPQ